MDHMSLRQPEQARQHMLAAWALARPDDFIEGLGEHHGLLGGMLEAVIKPEWPEDFKRIIDITYRFSAGWRKVHNPDTGGPCGGQSFHLRVHHRHAGGPGLDQPGDRRPPGVVPQYGETVSFQCHEHPGIRHRQDLKKFMLP